MWVIRYEHRHGTDVWVATSRPDADLSCAVVVLDYVEEEVDEPAKVDAILALVHEEKFWEAVVLYAREAGETFDVTEHEPRDEPTGAMLRARAEEKIERRAARAREDAEA